MLEGFVVAPATGEYNFLLKSDDSGRVWAATEPDTKEESRMVVAVNLNGCCREVRGDTAVEWTKGQKYYVRGIAKEGGGGDYLQIGFEDGGSKYMPIPISMFGIDAASMESADFDRTDGTCERADGSYEIVALVPEASLPYCKLQCTADPSCVAFDLSISGKGGRRLFKNGRYTGDGEAGDLCYVRRAVTTSVSQLGCWDKMHLSEASVGFHEALGEHSRWTLRHADGCDTSSWVRGCNSGCAQKFCLSAGGAWQTTASYTCCPTGCGTSRLPMRVMS